MKTKPEKGQTVRQINGPCYGQLFLVEDVDGNLLHVRLLDPAPGQNKDAEWSHWEDYVVTEEEVEELTTLEEVAESKPEPEQEDDSEPSDPAKRLAQFLECDPSDLKLKEYTHYGLEVYSHDANSEEYAIGTDSEATEAAKNHIKDSVWAFRASFLSSYCNLPEEVFVALHDKCEDSNDTILDLIERSGGFDEFAERAISADGRGHLLSPYDGGENEQNGYYIYRIN